MMQDLVGIVRRGTRWSEGAGRDCALKKRAAKVGGSRQSRIQRRLAYGARSAQSADGFRSRHAIAAIERKESRGAHFRDDYPEKTRNGRKFNLVIRQGRGRRRCKWRDAAAADAPE
jgi:succinate dehydrogenase / fumarate reductase flavoprotein subunit